MINQITLWNTLKIKPNKQEQRMASVLNKRLGVFDTTFSQMIWTFNVSPLWSLWRGCYGAQHFLVWKVFQRVRNQPMDLIFKVQCFVFFMVILCEPQNWIWGSSENRFNVINNQKTFPLNLTVGPCILLWLEIVPVFSNHSLVKPSNRRKYRLRCMGHSYKYKKFLSVVYLWNVSFNCLLAPYLA